MNSKFALILVIGLGYASLATLKILGLLLWPWWFVCFSVWIIPAVYFAVNFGVVTFTKLKELCRK